MVDYESLVHEEVEDFVGDVREEFRNQYDWIEADTIENSVGLDHLDGDNVEEFLNQNPLEVSVSFPIDHMTIEEFDEFDRHVNEFAEEEGVSVRTVEGNGDYIVYRFYLHGSSLDVPR